MSWISKGNTAVRLFLRWAIGLSFISASLDRLGLYNGILNEDQITWGGWNSFVEYTQFLIPWVPKVMAAVAGGIATIAEIAFGLLLLIGWKTKLVANLSGLLLLLFAISMFIQNLKSPFDYSVFSAAAACFALAALSYKK